MFEESFYTVNLETFNFIELNCRRRLCPKQNTYIVWVLRPLLSELLFFLNKQLEVYMYR